ncbi:conjugal transfer protein TrbF [Enterobacter bugandensis]|uniref:conjugal transfer protein TrbF n=1 Tax=Enterobacter bugandensis TaxID=881260 RepID=UPI002075B123|nr:conjugal transfer protein TrbF [Enterobacter bugandensis]MCM7239209.1 conjugal transfer protein TrbF [Enterobacter bugandensis]MCM7319093.1 conjugal transfer protein TrbF [Enterobacter bugandensis]MCM7354580.1 conjugal transfer protein TrbF [Enterobacter bugandensis]
MADQNNAEEHDMMTSRMLQRATTPELIALRARKDDARFGVYAEWAGILLIAGVLSRVFMTYVFDACVGDWSKSGHLQLKDLWNVLMYAIPLIFIALSGGLAVAGGVYAILNSLYTKGQMFILKRKMGKLALQASREGADVRP